MAVNPLKLSKLSGMMGPRMPKAEPSPPSAFRPERVLKKKEVKEIDKPMTFKSPKIKSGY